MPVELPCRECPLRELPLFLTHSADELALVQALKQRELRLAAGETLIHEGQTDTPLYTLLDGWAFRFKTLSDGRRQILNFLLAGDFIGVQQKMGEAASHGVTTLTDAVFCVFRRDALWELHRRSPMMGFNTTWLTAREEALVDDTLLSIGRRSAEERIASLLILLFKRAAALQPDGAEAGVPFPLTQQHLADALGLSLVHTNKTLRKLERRGLHRVRDGRLQLLDVKALARLADLYGDGPRDRWCRTTGWCRRQLVRQRARQTGPTLANMTTVRKGQAPPPLTREQFGERFGARFYDPAFDGEREAIGRLEAIAWQALLDGRKAPRTQAAGPGFADPAYEVSVEWLQTRARLQAAQQRWQQAPSRVLLICGAARNDGSCPGEISKTWRLTQAALQVVQELRLEADLLDLSLLTSEYGRRIHPCKGCVATAMPLCHWPCSCYPNHALDQTNDWMAEIYERWVAAHGVIIVAPTYWYQSPSPLKLMIDRLVCADGGNPDPTSTHGKKAVEAKALEQRGWHYPKHLAGRIYGLFVHGDVAGFESQRRNLADWLDWMGLIAAGEAARVDRAIGYYEPYYNSHEALDRDAAVQEEVRNVARAVVASIVELRAGRLQPPALTSPRPK
jgi:CRP-like cAMP-binding protein/multimeric flavodoxin WrbA